MVDDSWCTEADSGESMVETEDMDMVGDVAPRREKRLSAQLSSDSRLISLAVLVLLLEDFRVC